MYPFRLIASKKPYSAQFLSLEANNMGKEDHIVALGEPRPASADGKVPSASAIFRHAGSKDGFPSLDVSTLYELFSKSVEKYPDNDCLGVRVKNADGTAGAYQFKTYKQVSDEVALLASGLRAIGVDPKQRVGVLGPNCPEWMMAMQVGGMHRDAQH